jgi:tetratricopeptide (TPR) repeat protein
MALWAQDRVFLFCRTCGYGLRLWRLKQRPNSPKSRRPGERTGPPSPAHKWFFRLAAFFLVLVLPLGGLETVLRLAGYGYSTHFFRKMRIGDQEFLVNNDKVGLRFFPPELLRIPTPVRMKAQKPAGSYRIFILGESAAMGDPEPAFGAGRYLETLLRERFPDGNFEIVNVAMTAINSHTILPIARECAGHQGDLWIIYMGNNEMVGPFGAVTVFGAKAPPVGLVRLGLAVQRTRVGQLLMSVGRGLKGKSARTPAWGGMQMFAENRIMPDDPHKERVYRNFQSNLQDILRAGLDSGASVILSTVAVNLRDCPPFASLSNSNLPAADRTLCDKLFAEGALSEGQGKLADAAQRYEQAASLNPRSADLQFRWANCLLQQTNTGAALPRFQLACDYDALPFRADTAINTRIAQAGHRAASPRLALMDAVGLFTANSSSGVPGQESFYEHVHFTFDGNYVLGRAWAAEVERFLPAAITNHAAANWVSQETCERLLGLTDWNRCNVLEEVARRVQRPPLSGQFNNARRLAACQARISDLRHRMDSAAATKARATYLEALKRSPDDYFLHEGFADFLVAQGDFKQAEAQWQQVRELIPQDYLAYFEVGRLFALQGRWTEAQASLSRAVAVLPTFSDAWLELGKVHDAQGTLAAALEDYDRALRLQPHDYRIYFFQGKALAKSNRRAEAIESYRQAVRLNPDYWEAHLDLGGQLGLDEKVAEARNEFAAVIRLKPDVAMAHLNLGVALMKQRQLGDAAREFEETLRLEPGNKFAPDYLAQVRAMKSRAP